MNNGIAIDFETADGCPSSVCSVGIVIVRDVRTGFFSMSALSNRNLMEILTPRLSYIGYSL